MSQRWLGFFVVIASVSCFNLDRPLSWGEDNQITQIRTASESFLRAQVAQSWERWLTGAIRDPGAPALGREWLFTPTTLDSLRRAMRHEPRGDTRRALHYLHSMLVGEQIKLATLELDEKLWTLERSSLRLGSETVLFRDLPQRLAREPSTVQRRVWADLSLPVLEVMNPLLEARELEIRRVGRRLGYEHRLNLSSEFRQYDLRRIEALATRLLDDTEALYLVTLRELAAYHLGLDLNELTPADMTRLLYDPRSQESFPAESMLDVVESTVAALGINLSSLPILIDARPLSSKHPRPACFPVMVPKDIRLSVKPAGGAADYAALLHEVGHALHFAHARTVAFELQVLGDASGSEALALLFEFLADDPVWLNEGLGLVEPTLSEVTRIAALRRLFMARRYAARALVELAMQSGRAPNRAHLYRELLGRAYGFPLEAGDVAHATVDQDPFLETADYIRGWLLAATLTARLRSELGARWWQGPGARAFLEELWAVGQRDTADEISRRVGAGRLDTEALVRGIAQTLAVSRSRDRSTAFSRAESR